VGTELVCDAEGEAELVPSLLELKRKCDDLHVRAFERSETFGYALREAFESLVNARQNRPAELLAKYLDAQLRAGAKAGAGDEDLEAVLDRTMALFRYINGKDMFEAFYKKDLAKRLLVGKSASIDAEKLLISKLKAECGAGFTNKLEGMFKDCDASADLLLAFRAQPVPAQGAAPSEIELSAHVLTTGFWPAYPALELALPEEMVVLQERFAAFYLAKHSGRRLRWAHTLGHCHVRALFAARAHELQLSLLQTVVCLLFNEADTLELAQIAAETRIGAGAGAQVAASAPSSFRPRRPTLACGRPRAPRTRAPAPRRSAPPRTPARPPARSPARLAGWLGAHRRGQGAAADAAVPRVRQGARALQGAQREGGRGWRRLHLPRGAAAQAAPHQDQLDPAEGERRGARADHREGLCRQAVPGARTHAQAARKPGAAPHAVRPVRVRRRVSRSTLRSCA
jgi:hypothetical protein